MGLVPWPSVFGTRHWLAGLVYIVRVLCIFFLGGLGVGLAEAGGFRAAAERTFQLCSEWHARDVGRGAGWSSLGRVWLADVAVGGYWQIRNVEIRFGGGLLLRLGSVV